MIVDLFAGVGWSEGLADLGLTDVGFDSARNVCATRRACGHLTVMADLEQYPPETAVGAEGIIASPPCPDWSVAGKRKGRDGTTGSLIDVVPRWVHVVRPEWVLCEQVPPCLDIWREHARLYEQYGYSTWTGLLNAANFGVPQTRVRAFLVASRLRVALPPEPSHAKYADSTVFGTLLPWVSMAQALGWDGEDTPARTVCGNREPRWMYDDPDGTHGRTVQTGANTMKHSRDPDDVVLYERSIDEPAPTVDRKAGSAWTVNTGRDRKPGGAREDAQSLDAQSNPAPSLTGKSGGQWQLNPGRTDAQPNRRTYDPDEPAPVVAEGHDASAGTDAIRLTVTDALILQGFRPDLPVQGTKTAQSLQIANAVPPPLAARLAAKITGRE